MIPVAFAIPGLPKFLVPWLVGHAVSFVVRQIDKWEDTIDWSKVKADLKPRVEALLPGEILDEEGVALLNAMVDKLAKALGDTAAIKRILEATAKGDWAGAFEAVKDLVLAGVAYVAATEASPEEAAAARDAAFVQALVS